MTETTGTCWSSVPLSEEQEGLLYTQRLTPDSARYNVPMAFELVGDLDVAALERALAALVGAHPLLTAIPADGSLSADPGRGLPLSRRDALGLSETAAIELLRAEAMAPLDIDGTGMSRALLVTTAEDRHYLLLVTHHVVLDGESSSVLVAELWRFYTATRSESQAQVDTPASPQLYAEAVQARQARLARDGERLRAYWREVLAERSALIDLPSDGTLAEPGSAEVALELDAEAVTTFARRHRLGVFALLLAAYERTLARYARQERVAVAIPASTRNDPRLDGVIGYFINTVLAQSPRGDQQTAIDFARTAQAELARAIDNSALPYPRIAELSGIDGQGFNCVFTFQSWYDRGAFGDAVPGLRIRLLEEIRQPVVGDLTLEMFADGDRLRGSLRYATDRFAAKTAKALAAQIVSTLSAMVRHAERPVGLLPDIAPREDTTDSAFDRETDIDALVREAARRHSERIAVTEGGRRWRYRDLDDTVSRLAAGLRARGITPGDAVGIWLPRSAEQVFAVLAVLRAGAVFVPLDTAHPEHRLDAIAHRAGLGLIVRQQSDRPTPAGLPGATLDELDTDRPPVAAEGRADALAYVLFTSGSTGVPKGVAIGHRAFVNHLTWSRRYFDVTPEDAMAFSGALSFDVTLHQLFVPLVCGARLVVVPDGKHRDPDAMAETLHHEGVTLLHVVPALLRMLVDSPAFASARKLRAVVSAGEALTNHLRRAFEAVQSAKLYNAYGPTEATVYATVFDASRADRQRWTHQSDVPIGDALDNVRCHVLDDRQRPVPRGAPGELCIAGEALAMGYHNDPERTAQQFREIELGSATERVYRTGDLVRELPEGGLSYLGRLDHQVKLNGFRIELGEVEAAMQYTPGVREAVAVVRGHAEGHSQLVGYVTPDNVDVASVRATVAGRLPGYMVPVHIVALPDLPRLPSGKTDRKSLPAPTAAVSAPEPADHTPASGSALALVRRVWTDVLSHAPKSDAAHFFESGGDSILAMRLVSALRRAGAMTDVRTLHDKPVLADLAAALDTGTIAPAATPAVHGDGPGLAPIQAWFLRTVRTDRHHWNQSVLLDIVEPVDPAHLALALQAVVLAHPMLSARVPDGAIEELTPFTALSPQGLLDSTETDSAEAQERAVREVQHSLDPETGIMLRARQLKDTAGGHDRLLLVIHHLAVDGVSWRVLLEDLDLALRALAAGELPRLPAEGESYRHWLAGLPRLAADQDEIAHWRAVASDRRAADTLLCGAPAGVEGDTRRIETFVDEELTTALLGPLPATLDMPVHDMLTGLVALALARWRGCRTVTLDVETHGRQATAGDISRTVGWFTALHPVVLQVDRTLDPAEHLQAVRQDLAAVPGGGSGFGACREFAASAVRAELAKMPAALVCFNYLGRIDSDIAGPRFRIVDDAVPGERSPRAERTHGIELYGVVRDGKLRLGASWAPVWTDGIEERTVHALLDQLHATITTLAGEEEHRQNAVPLNPQQYGILVDALARPGNGRYVEQMAWTWHGPLEIERFTEAWRQTVHRHAALRAAFAWDGTPRLLIDPEVPPEIRVRTDVTWERLLEEDRARGFDLDTPGLLRLALVPENDTHRILLSFHHALLDGWSMAIVLEDFYLAYLGHPRALDPAEPDIRTHARWLAAQDTSEAEAFWSSRLRGADPAVRPGVTGPVTGDAGFGRAALRWPLADLADTRAAVARQAATESTLFQALWAVLLWRFAGGEDTHDVGFGITVSGRGIDLPGVERIAGLLMTTLPLTINVHPNEPLLDLVRRIREQALEASAFEWVSVGQVHDWSGRRGSDPLFESLLVVENYPSDLGEVGHLLDNAGIRVEPPSVIGAETAYPCALLLHHEADELVMTLVHDRAVVPPDAAERIVDLWRRLLSRLRDRGAPRVADLVDGIADDLLPVIAARPVAQAPVDAATTTNATWPDSPWVATVKEVWQEVLGVPDVAPSDHFFTSGGHSLAAGRFLQDVAARSGIPVRLDDLLLHPTAAGFAAALASTPADRAEGNPLVPLRPGRPPAIYLIHPPGGQVACYSAFARHYGGRSAIIGIRDPRIDRPGTPEDRTVRELAEEYHDLLAPRLGDSPIVLGGFSGGGVIAQELAGLLHASTSRAPLVLLIDAAAPTGEVTDTAAEGSFLHQVMAHDRARRSNGAEGAPKSGADYLDELATVADWMSGSGQADPYGLLSTTLAAVERHRPRRFAGPAAVLRASETDFGGDSDFDAAARYYRSPGLGWEGLCEDLSVHVVPGNHVSLMTGENARALARTVAGLVQRHTEGE
nr:non-ribosomal peptide synthetase [Halomonas piscis]